MRPQKIILWILLLFLIWRTLLFVPIILGNSFLKYREGYSYTRILYYNASPKSIVNNFLISPWANFDGVAYLGIAGNGYTTGNVRFFPLFPGMVWGISYLLHISKSFEFGQFLVALVFSNICFLGSLLVFYKLIRLDFSEKTAFHSLFFLLIFPTSFFFGSIYTESLFLLLSLLSFYFARKKQWIMAGICGTLLSATRIVGVAMLPVLLWEFFTSRHPGKSAKQDASRISKRWRFWMRPLWGTPQNDIVKLLSILLIPLGLLFFMYFNYQKWGDPLLFLHQQGNVLNGRSVNTMVFIPQTLYRYGKILVTVSPFTHFEWWISFLELSSFVFTSIMLYVAWKKKIRPSYILFAILCFVVPTLTGTFSGLPRYILILFPMFMALALTKNKVAKIIYIFVSVLLLGILLTFFSKGYFIA